MTTARHHRLLALVFAALLAMPALANDPRAPTAHAVNLAPVTTAALRQRLAAMPAGQAERGEALYAQQFCASCHGDKGQAPTLNWPSVAGQRAPYTYKLLQDYQQGLRREGERAALMRDAVVGLTPQQLSDLAAYLARPAPRTDTSATTVPTPPDVQRLVRDGDPARLLTACASCHGARGQGGNHATPALAGQNPAYLVRTLLDYQSGLRANDPAHGMRAFAARLTRAEIDGLARYYAGLPAAR